MVKSKDDVSSSPEEETDNSSSSSSDEEPDLGRRRNEKLKCKKRLSGVKASSNWRSMQTAVNQMFMMQPPGCYNDEQLPIHPNGSHMAHDNRIGPLNSLNQHHHPGSCTCHSYQNPLQADAILPNWIHVTTLNQLEKQPEVCCPVMYIPLVNVPGGEKNGVSLIETVHPDSSVQQHAGRASMQQQQQQSTYDWRHSFHPIGQSTPQYQQNLHAGLNYNNAIEHQIYNQQQQQTQNDRIVQHELPPVKANQMQQARLYDHFPTVKQQQASSYIPHPLSLDSSEVRRGIITPYAPSLIQSGVGAWEWVHTQEQQGQIPDHNGIAVQEERASIDKPAMSLSHSEGAQETEQDEIQQKDISGHNTPGPGNNCQENPREPLQTLNAPIGRMLWKSFSHIQGPPDTAGTHIQWVPLPLSATVSAARNLPTDIPVAASVVARLGNGAAALTNSTHSTTSWHKGHPNPVTSEIMPTWPSVGANLKQQTISQSSCGGLIPPDSLPQQQQYLQMAPSGPDMASSSIRDQLLTPNSNCVHGYQGNNLDSAPQHQEQVPVNITYQELSEAYSALVRLLEVKDQMIWHLLQERDDRGIAVIKGDMASCEKS